MLATTKTIIIIKIEHIWTYIDMYVRKNNNNNNNNNNNQIIDKYVRDNNNNNNNKKSKSNRSGPILTSMS